jgi:hypothetical protein
MRQEPVADALIVWKAVHQDYRRILAGDLADDDAAGGFRGATRSSARYYRWHSGLA